MFLSCAIKGIMLLQRQGSSKEIYISKVNPSTEHNISDFDPIAWTISFSKV